MSHQSEKRATRTCPSNHRVSRALSRRNGRRRCRRRKRDGPTLTVLCLLAVATIGYFGWFTPLASQLDAALWRDLATAPPIGPLAVGGIVGMVVLAAISAALAHRMGPQRGFYVPAISAILAVIGYAWVVSNPFGMTSDLSSIVRLGALAACILAPAASTAGWLVAVKQRVVIR